MFGWMKPSCPVEGPAKEWLEHRLNWLGDEFGVDVFTRRALILPTDEFFPDRYDATDSAARTLLDRICEYMDVDPDAVEFQVAFGQKEIGLVNERNEAIPNTFGGLYDDRGDRILIHVAEDELHHPMGLVGTMAHEISHLRLLGEHRLDGREFDNELLTDLTSIFFGFGIFAANNTRVWHGLDSTWPGTGVRRPEYMTPPMIGHALAHLAWIRGEQSPEWKRHLAPDARECFKQGLSFLWKTGDTRFRPQFPGRKARFRR
jgi:hypothetical protein